MGMSTLMILKFCGQKLMTLNYVKSRYDLKKYLENPEHFPSLPPLPEN